MGKNKHRNDPTSEGPAKLSNHDYKQTLYDLQVELVKLQRHVIRKGIKMLLLFEGRDAAGKDGIIKRIAEHLSPRETRLVALAKPSDREASGWYFQRWVPQLPVGGEIVLFNRSWYNRAGVERVMGFCTQEEYETFMEDAPRFEELLVRSDMVLRKYYLDISKDEQKRRIEARKDNPLKQWKVSPIDETSVQNWEKYSEARNEMLARTHTVFAPWKIVRADNKKLARINMIKDLLLGVQYKGKNDSLLLPNPDIVFGYSEEYVKQGMIAP